MPPIKPAKNFTGAKRADTLVGNELDNTLQGKAGDDTLTGGDGSDVFKFEKSLKDNGLDTITDYHLTKDGSDGKGQDVLDLTAALKNFKDALARGEKVAIEDYVQLEHAPDGGGMKLMVDQDGEGGKDPEQWAFLDGLTAGDQVRVRAFTVSGSGSAPDIGDGYFTIGGATESTHIFVLSESGYQLAYGDTNGDGLLGKDDAILGSNSTGAWVWGSGFSFGNGSYTLEYLGFAPPSRDPVDLSGFDADDFLVFNFRTRNALTATTVSLAGYPTANKVTVNEIPFGRLANLSGSGFGLTTSRTTTLAKAASRISWYHSAAVGSAASRYMRLGVDFSHLPNEVAASYALLTTAGSIANRSVVVIGQWASGTVTLTGAQITVSWP